MIDTKISVLGEIGKKVAEPPTIFGENIFLPEFTSMEPNMAKIWVSKCNS